MRARFIGLDDPEWDRVVRQCADHDIYHLAAFQRAPTPLDTGTPWLAVVEDPAEGFLAALPLRLRPVNEVEAIRREGTIDDTLVDGVSPYGYPGLIVAGPPRADEGQSTSASFSAAIDSLLRTRGVVSAWIRQHPLIDTTRWFLPPFETRRVGTTVAIDLRLPDDVYHAQTRATHRASITSWDTRSPSFDEPGRSALSAFGDLYRDTMRRKGAASAYLFSDAYFEALGNAFDSAKDDACRVFEARTADSTEPGVAMAIVLTSRSRASYHLAASGGSASGLGRWLLERIRRRLKDEGFASIHLGGGVGAAPDSLFDFKAGFSAWRPDFHAVTWVGDRVAYDRLVARSGAPETDYFPAYRVPR